MLVWPAMGFYLVLIHELRMRQGSRFKPFQLQADMTLAPASRVPALTRPSFADIDSALSAAEAPCRGNLLGGLKKRGQVGGLRPFAPPPPPPF
jgi:hypothetical protein